MGEQQQKQRLSINDWLDIKFPEEFSRPIRQEIRKLLQNKSAIPNRESIVASWNLPFGMNL